MTHFDVIISGSAKNDLRGIYEYIAFELLAPQAAANQLYRLERAIYSLDSMPYRFSALELEPWKSRGMRTLPVNNYIIFYIPDDNHNVVNVIRVMYSGRDIAKAMSEDE